METDVLYGVEYETDKFFICGVISILLQCSRPLSMGRLKLFVAKRLDRSGVS